MFWKRRNITRKKKRTVQKSSEPKMVLIRQIVFGVLLFLLLALLGAGVWYGSRIDRLTIEEVEVLGGETIKHSEIEEIAREELTGTYYKLVPRRFALTYPREQMIERIQGIDRLKNVHIERASGKKIVIVFEEYTPFALWCADIDSTECLFMDREGYGFSWAPKLQGGAFLRFSEVGRTPEQFTTGFAGDYIQETDTFIKRVYDEIGMNITHVERTGKEELQYYIAGGGTLKVSRRMSTDETFNNLLTLLSSEAFSHIEPGNFQYIDLRYGNKLFVNEEDPNAITATSTATSTTESELE